MAPKTSFAKAEQDPKVFMPSDSSEKSKEPEDIKPTDANSIDEIKAYLDKHEIDYKGVTKKAELLNLVGD